MTPVRISELREKGEYLSPALSTIYLTVSFSSFNFCEVFFKMTQQLNASVDLSTAAFPK